MGSMVSDVHRTVLYGGVYLYPADKAKVRYFTVMYCIVLYCTVARKERNKKEGIGIGIMKCEI